jgi:hypothetical protein
MFQFLPDPLTAEEYASLVLLGRSPRRDDLPQLHEDRLVLLGFARRITIGVVLTNEGLQWIGLTLRSRR